MNNLRRRLVAAMAPGTARGFDQLTEVLTTAGWKPIAQATTADRVCTIDDDDRIQYLEPNWVHRFPRGGRMYAIQTQQVDLYVTINHLMYVALRDRDEFELLAAEEIVGREISYKKNGLWCGRSPAYFEFNGAVRRCRHRRTTGPAGESENLYGAVGGLPG